MDVILIFLSATLTISPNLHQDLFCESFYLSIYCKKFFELFICSPLCMF